MTARGRRTRRAAGAVALAAAALLLSACSTTSGSVDGSTRYVAGDGSTVLLAPADREAAPGSPARPWTATRSTSRRTAARSSW